MKKLKVDELEKFVYILNKNIDRRITDVSLQILIMECIDESLIELKNNPISKCFDEYLMKSNLI